MTIETTDDDSARPLTSVPSMCDQIDADVEDMFVSIGCVRIGHGPMPAKSFWEK